MNTTKEEREEAFQDFIVEHYKHLPGPAMLMQLRKAWMCGERWHRKLDEPVRVGGHD